MDLPQTVGREQGGADGVAVAHVVVARTEAIGGEQLFEVLAQGGRLTGKVGAWNRFALGDQVLGQRRAGLAVKRLLQQMAQQHKHPLEHLGIGLGRVAPIHTTNPGANSPGATSPLASTRGLGRCCV